MKSFVVGALIVCLVLGALMYSRTRSEISWMPSYEATSTQPLGSRAFVEWLQSKKRIVEHEHDNEFIVTLPSLDTAYAIVIITQSLVLDERNREALLSYVQQGGSAVIAAQWIDDSLTQKLEIRINAYDDDQSCVDSRDSLRQLPTATSTDVVGGFRSFEWDDARDGDTNGRYGPWQALVHSEQGAMRAGRRKIGRGEVTVIATPELFTNYAILDSTYRFYTALMAEQLPDKELVFDKHYKPTSKQRDEFIDMVTEDPAIRFSYLVALWTSVAYVILSTRRRQRIIPIRKPPRNTSVEFAQTVAQLYDVRKSYDDVAVQLVNQFVWYVRRRSGWRIGIDETDNSQLARIIGAPIEDVDRILAAVEAVLSRRWVSNKQNLEKLQNLLLPIIDKDLS
jgi:hypothetical protein